MRRARASAGILGLSVVGLVAAATWAAVGGNRPGTMAIETGPMFSCPSPTHHDGDAIRCAGMSRSARLYAIDAPEMPGACRPGRICTPGDPYAPRDHLAGLTAGKDVSCRVVDANLERAGFQETDGYGRPVLQCFAGRARLDLSCMMVKDGFAVERYGELLGCEP